VQSEPSSTPRPAAVPAADAEVYELCRRGDRAGYERLYHAHGGRMKSIAWNLLHNQEDAEDAVQETFLKVHRSIHTFARRSSFATWVYRILVNTCTDRQRSRRVRTEALPENLPGRAPGPGLRIALERALAELSERHRTVFLLAEVEGLSHAEICSILGVALGTSKGLLFEARRTLRDLLDPGKGPVRRFR
jgi:RNA polymerase sigma-70 factor (ECF subfamily)